MKWFYKLNRKIRNIISAACWTTWFIVSAIFGRIFGDSVGENGFVVFVVLALLGVSIAASVFASKATKQEKAAEKQRSAAELKAKQEAEDSERAARWEMEAQKRKEYEKSLIFPDKPTFTVKLIKNGNSEMQDNMNCVNVGGKGGIYYDSDKELFLCCIEGFDVGYIPAQYNNQCNNDSKSIIIEMPLSENDKYSVIVDVYTPVKVNTQFSTNADILPRRTKAKGVSFDNRQDYLRDSRSGDILTIKHTPTKEYPNTIAIINDRTGKNLGNVSSELADELLSVFGNGCCFNGKILDITGGDGLSFGCNIVIDSEKQ